MFSNGNSFSRGNERECPFWERILRPVPPE